MWQLFFMCDGCTDEYNTDSLYEYEEEEEDYSWIYGTWKLSIDGEEHIIGFSENGIYISTFNSPYYGRSTETGYYSIEPQNNCIRLKANGEKYSSYIEIDGKRLKENGHYYRKR